MSRPAAPGVVFIILGVVFIAIGSSGWRALFAVGAAFLIIGLVSVVRERRAGGLK
jgi:hypothetical protein